MQTQNIAELIYKLCILVHEKKPVNACYIDRKILLWADLCDKNKVSCFVIKILLENEIRQLENL